MAPREQTKQQTSRNPAFSGSVKDLEKQNRFNIVGQLVKMVIERWFSNHSGIQLNYSDR